MKKETKDINKFILFIVIAVYISAQKYLPPLGSNFAINFIISYLTSLGFYNILIGILYWLVNNLDSLLKLYYGKTFLKGIWSYTYILNDKIYFGLWNIDQDLNGIVVEGYGLNIDGSARSDVRSVSQLIFNKGAFDIVNTRIDTIDPEKETFSKTTLHPIIDKKSIFKPSYPKKMMARTYIYGGKLSGNIHLHVMFEKHENQTAEIVKANLLDDIKSKYKDTMYVY